MKIISLLILSFILMGCGPLIEQQIAQEQKIDKERRTKYVESHPELSDTIRKDILNGIVRVGMTVDQVRVIEKYFYWESSSVFGDMKIETYKSGRTWYTFHNGKLYSSTTLSYSY